jgi:hypothetical protein
VPYVLVKLCTCSMDNQPPELHYVDSINLGCFIKDLQPVNPD